LWNLFLSPLPNYLSLPKTARIWALVTMARVTGKQIDTKQASPVHTPPPDTESANGKLEDVVDKAVPERYRGTAQDRRDMLVHGKKQELRRNFKRLTMTGFASMVVCAWEGLLPLFNYALLDGGTALMFWGFIGVAISMSLVYLSVAELASM
jgi:hypothetical protein